MLSYSTFKKDKKGQWTLEDVSLPKYEVGEKLVDDSKYRPNQPIMHQVNGSCAECLNYDFPDGNIDTDLGMQMAFLRRRGLTASEFNTYLESLQHLDSAQKEALAEELKDTLKQKLADKALENLAKDNVSSDSSNTASSSKA